MVKVLRGVLQLKMQTKKGFILIYTFLVGIICLSIMMYIFDIQMSEVKYATGTKKYVLKEEDNYHRCKEYLMTLFFTYINANSAQIKILGINEFFKGSTNEIVKYEGAKVIYSNVIKEFIFVTPYEARTNRNDYFKLEDDGENFKMVFIKTYYLDK